MQKGLWNAVDEVRGKSKVPVPVPPFRNEKALDLAEAS